MMTTKRTSTATATERDRSIIGSIEEYIQTQKIDDLFTRILSQTLTERPENVKEYIRKLCSSSSVDASDHDDHELDNNNAEVKETMVNKSEVRDDCDEKDLSAIVIVKHNNTISNEYLNDVLGILDLFALLADSLVVDSQQTTQKDPLEVLENKIAELRMHVRDNSSSAEPEPESNFVSAENENASLAPARADDYEEEVNEEEEEEEEEEEDGDNKEEQSDDDDDESSEGSEAGDIVSGLSMNLSLPTPERPTFLRRQSVSAECFDRQEVLKQWKKDKANEGMSEREGKDNDEKISGGTCVDGLESLDRAEQGEEKNEAKASATASEKETLLKIISASPLMSRLSNQIQIEIVDNLRKEQVFKKDDCIINQGSTANCLYILEDGECEVFKKISEAEDAKKVNVVDPVTCFGELGLLHDCARAASVICSSDKATIWSLDRSIFRQLVMFAGG